MTTHLSAAQQAQVNNRDDNGKWQQKSHGDVEDTADVLGVESDGEIPRHGLLRNYTSVSTASDEFNAARAEAERAELQLATDGYDPETQEASKQADRAMRQRAESLSVTAAGRGQLQEQYDTDRRTEQRLMGDEHSPETYDKLTATERAAYHTAQKSRDFVQIQTMGTQREARSKQVAALGIGEDAKDIPVTEARRSLTEVGRARIHYLGRDLSKDATVLRSTDEAITFNDAAGNPSTLDLRGVKAQRDRNGNILVSKPDMAGGLPFAAYEIEQRDA